MDKQQLRPATIERINRERLLAFRRVLPDHHGFSRDIDNVIAVTAPERFSSADADRPDLAKINRYIRILNRDLDSVHAESLLQAIQLYFACSAQGRVSMTMRDQSPMSAGKLIDIWANVAVIINLAHRMRPERQERPSRAGQSVPRSDHDHTANAGKPQSPTPESGRSGGWLSGPGGHVARPESSASPEGRRRVIAASRPAGRHCNSKEETR